MIQETRTVEARQPTAQRRAFEGYRPAFLSRVTWGAIIAGTVVAVAVQVLFASLGLAIGLSIPAAAATAEGMGIFAGIWWLITGIIALFIGGWVAGRYTAIGQEMEAGLHGVMVWCLATALSVLFVTTFGGVLMAGAAGAIGDQIAPQAGMQMNAGAGAGQDATAIVPDVEADRGAAAGAAWWTFFALLLGLAAAGIGGYVATPREGAMTGGHHDTGSTGVTGPTRA